MGGVSHNQQLPTTPFALCLWCQRYYRRNSSKQLFCREGCLDNAQEDMRYGGHRIYRGKQLISVQERQEAEKMDREAKQRDQDEREGLNSFKFPNFQWKHEPYTIHYSNNSSWFSRIRRSSSHREDLRPLPQLPNSHSSYQTYVDSQGRVHPLRPLPPIPRQAPASPIRSRSPLPFRDQSPRLRLSEDEFPILEAHSRPSPSYASETSHSPLTRRHVSEKSRYPLTISPERDFPVVVPVAPTPTTEAFISRTARPSSPYTPKYKSSPSSSASSSSTISPSRTTREDPNLVRSISSPGRSPSSPLSPASSKGSSSASQRSLGRAGAVRRAHSPRAETVPRVIRKSTSDMSFLHTDPSVYVQPLMSPPKPRFPSGVPFDVATNDSEIDGETWTVVRGLRHGFLDEFDDPRARFRQTVTSIASIYVH